MFRNFFSFLFCLSSITWIYSFALNSTIESPTLRLNFTLTQSLRESNKLDLNATSTDQIVNDFSTKRKSNAQRNLACKNIGNKITIGNKIMKADENAENTNQKSHKNISGRIIIDDKVLQISLNDSKENSSYAKSLRNHLIDWPDSNHTIDKPTHKSDLRNVNLVENDANKNFARNQTNEPIPFVSFSTGNSFFNSTEKLMVNSFDMSKSTNSSFGLFELSNQTVNHSTAFDKKSDTNSSVVHLLSNEDIKEYHSKRKEEDEINIEHLKEKQIKKSKVKFEVNIPQLIKSKSQNAIESNNINHLQEIDIADDVKSVKETHKPQLIVISLDAMRHDYVKMFRNNMYNFQQIAKIGVTAPFGIYPSFITQTIASHYSIATGLYQESTGIIDNRFYDPMFNESFKSYSMKSKFFAGEPIWTTAVKNNLESRIYFWPGSEVAIGGVSPTESRKFNLTTPFREQIEQVIEWIENGSDLCMAYHGQPDSAGHNFGIGSKEMTLAIKEINFVLGILIDYVKQKNINLIITSDHGMVEVDKNKLVYLEDYLDFREEIVRIPQFGSVTAIQPKEGRLEQVMEKLAKVPYVKCYRKDEIPEHYHYKHHYRIQPIICVSKLASYLIRTRDDYTPKFGIHGYDPKILKMRAVFFAMGPDFKQNYITHPFEQVNLYSLFAHLLHIQPANNNGSIHNLKHILSDSSLSRLV